MHASTTCKILLSGTSDKLELAADYLEKMQRGEYFMDEDNESLVLRFEEDLDMASKDDVVDFIEMLYKKFKKKIDIHALGTFNAIGSDAQQKFECQCNKNFFRYRETEWGTDFDIDEDLSYEEFEEENGIDVDEDEYEEYVHRAHDGIVSNSGNSFGDWEYLD
jgi:hypothetical protein